MRASLLFAGLILVLITIPSFQAVFEYRLLRYLAPLFFLWLLIIHSESPGVLMRVFRNRFGELALYGYWCAFILLYAGFVPGGESIHVLMGNVTKLLYSLLQILFCYIMGMVYASENDGRASRWLIKFLLIAFGLNALISLPLLLGSDLAVRAYINSYQSIAGRGQISISIFTFGGLGFYAAEALLSALFLETLLEAKGFVRFVFSCLFICIAINIFLCTLLIVQIGFFASVALFIFQKMGSAKVSLRLRFGILILAGILAFMFTRFADMRAMQYSLNRLPTLTGQQVYNIEGNTTTKRIMLYSASINSFISYPILGLGFAKYIGINLSNQGNWIGGHSGILDGLAMYGLLPFGFFVLFLWVKYRHLRKMTTRESDTLVFPLTICFLLYCYQILFDPLLFNSSVTGIFFFAVIGSAVVPNQQTDIPRKRPPGRI
jgi:hypothetical protein